MDETMMIYLINEVGPLIQLGAAFIVALLVVLVLCVSLIKVFS
jgi:hypothetical protein